MTKEFQFYINDISEDITLEGEVEYLQMEELVKKIRSQDWFIEGNRTEGKVTFYSDFDIWVNWTTITMVSDIVNEYSQDCIINPDKTTFKTIEF